MKIAVDDPIKEAETLLGQAALRVWGDLPRDGQELLFESAVGDDDHMRKLLAVFLHDRHPKTYHPPKPDKPASEDATEAALGLRDGMRLTIYIALQGEATDVWRPVEAEHVSGDYYRILSPKPSDEIWPFNSNEIVRCERKFLSGENCLVAAN